MNYILYITTVDGRQFSFNLNETGLKEVKKSVQESKALVLENHMFIVSNICSLYFISR